MSAVSGADLYTMANCTDAPNCPDGRVILRYRGDDDEWDILPTPEPLVEPRLLTPLTDGTVIAYRVSDELGESPDYRLVEGDRWEPLPDDPLPAVSQRFFVEDGESVFVFGTPISGDQPSKVGARFDSVSNSWTELAAADSGGGRVWRGDSGFYLDPQFGNGGDARGGLFNTDTGTWGDLPSRPTSPLWLNDMAGVIGTDDATYESASGWILDTTTGRWIRIEPHPPRPTDGVAVGNSGRRLVVYGGVDADSSGGRLLNEAWVWTP
jgi:hypothetical protein